MERSDKKYKTTLILFFLLGFHRGYVGKYFTQVLYWFTGGGFLIWLVIDFILLVTDGFTDKEGRKLQK